MEVGATIASAGNSVEYKVGDWRTQRAQIDYTRCTKCLICWIYCPEPCIEREGDGGVRINYDYCKGCGICAEECPVKCIDMVPE